MSNRPSSLSDIDLNLLVALDALLEVRSVTAAGERLSVTQSTMSGILARLRAIFDDDLLVRSGHGMQPTRLGAALQAPLRETLSGAQQLLFTNLDFDPERDTREFTILAPDSVMVTLLQPLTAALLSDYPGIQIEMTFGTGHDYEARVEHGGVDVALVPDRYTMETVLHTKFLYSERVIGAVWRDNDKVGDRLTVDDLLRLPYTSDKWDGMPSWPDYFLADKNIHLRPAAIIQNVILRAALLRGTSSYTFLPAGLISEYEDPFELRAVEPPIELPPLNTVMVWHSRTELDPGNIWLRQQIANRAAELALADNLDQSAHKSPAT